MVKLKSCGLRNPDTHLIPGVFHWVIFVCTMYTPMKCMNMQIEMFMDAGKYIRAYQSFSKYFVKISILFTVA